mmetsp:Transcript_18454/g.42724  ORF Transcript_18454/g.42724 Transcript_18454/m.42724 type:complete len:112 (-) Transcript_18454:51-386(-)
MQDRMVLVVCNLKAAKLAGFSSSGMVLAAKLDDKVELVTPPDGSEIGERVTIAGLSGNPFSAAQVKKKKIFDVVAKTLRTNADCVATWNDGALETKAGKCTTATLANAPIS